jgi:hypothetical protein
MTLAWLRLPPPAVAVVWAAFALLVFEIGLRLAFPRFRLLAHTVAAAVFVRLYVFELWGFGDALKITYRPFTILPILASFYYIWSRHRAADIPDWERSASRLYTYAAAIFAVILARFELGPTYFVAVWAMFGLALYEFGQLRNIADLRWQSYAIAVLSFFTTTALLPGDSAHVLVAAAVVASFYGAQLLTPRDAAGLERYARAFYSLLASFLLAILLYFEVSGGLLTTVWAAEALALLGAGFPLRDRLQRLSGLALFLVCVLKLFLYDLRELDTVSRILSFIVLGLILVGVSWMYTRFRDRIQRYL